MKTVNVLIAIGVGSRGEYRVLGDNDYSPSEVIAELSEAFEDATPGAIYWIDVEVPVPARLSLLLEEE